MLVCYFGVRFLELFYVVFWKCGLVYGYLFRGVSFVRDLVSFNFIDFGFNDISIK